MRQIGHIMKISKIISKQIEPNQSTKTEHTRTKRNNLTNRFSQHCRTRSWSIRSIQQTVFVSPVHKEKANDGQYYDGRLHSYVEAGEIEHVDVVDIAKS